MAWTIQVPLHADESLSSWLVRAALHQGCDPLTLTGHLWPHWRAWTLDLDRGFPGERARSVARLSGVSMRSLAGSCLSADAERIAGPQLQSKRVWPWVLALGARNRRRLGGQQYCPACLAGDRYPYLRRHWRFAWHTGCARHEVRLLDRCSTCASPITSHRLSADAEDLATCSECRTDLRHAPCVAVPEGALAFQFAADHALAGAASAWGSGLLPTVQWFAMAAFLVRLARRAGRQRGSALADALGTLDALASRDCVPLAGLPFELLPVGDRAVLSRIAARLIAAGPERLAPALITHGVSAAALRDVQDPLPHTVAVLAAGLPHGRRAARKLCRQRPRTRSKRAVLAAWTRLERKVRACGR